MSHALGLCYGDISHAHVSMRDPFIDLLVCFKNPALSNLNAHPTINSNNLAGADIDLDASSDSGSVYGAAVTGDNIYQYYHDFCLARLLPDSTTNPGLPNHPNHPTSTSASSVFSTSETTRSIVVMRMGDLVPSHVRVCLLASLDEAMVERLPEIVKFFLMAISDGDGMRLSDEVDGGASRSGGGGGSVWGNGGFKQVLKSVSRPKPYARNRFSANLPSDTSSALGSELNNPTNTNTHTHTDTSTTTKTEKRYMILLPIYIPARLIASPDTNTNAGRRMSVRTMESLEMQCRARMVACLANVGGREWRRAHRELVEWCDRYATKRLPSGHNTLSRLTLSRLTLNNNNDHDSHNANTLTRSKTLRHANAYPSLGHSPSMMSLNTRTERRGRTRSRRGVGSDLAPLSQSVAETVRTVGSIRTQLNEANLRVHNATNDREDVEEDLRKLKRRVSSRGTSVKAQAQFQSRSQSRVQPERQLQPQQQFQIQPQIYNIPIQLEQTQIPGQGQMVLREEQQQQQLSANYIPNLDLGAGFDLGALASELADAYAPGDFDFGLGQGGNVNNISVNNNDHVAYTNTSLNVNVDLGPNTSHDTYGYTNGGAVAGVDSTVYPSSNPVNHVDASGSGSGYNAYNNTHGNGYGTNYGTNFDNSGTSNLGNRFTGDFNNTFSNSNNCVNGNVSNNVNLNANNAYVSSGPVMPTNATAASMIPTPTLLPAAPISDNLTIHAPAPVPAIYEIPGIFEQIAASQQQYHQQQQQQQQTPVTPPAPTSVPVQQQEITQAQYAAQAQSSAYASASYVPSPVTLQAQDVFSLQAQEQQRLQEDILRQLEEFAQQSSSSASAGTLPLQTSMSMPSMPSTPSMSTMHPAPEPTLILPPLQSPIHLVSSPSTSSSSSFGILPLPGGYPVINNLDMSGIIDAGDGSGFISYASASSSGSGSGSALSSAYASPHSSASASGFDFLSAIDDASSAFNALASADEASTAGGQIQDDTMGAPKSRDFWQSVINFIPLKM